jgi:hypothetical protein
MRLTELLEPLNDILFTALNAGARADDLRLKVEIAIRAKDGVYIHYKIKELQPIGYDEGYLIVAEPYESKPPYL